MQTNNTESFSERRTSTFHLMSIAPNVVFDLFFISQLSLKPGEEEIKKKGW